MNKKEINKARALYYNLFANFFVTTKEITNYLELIKLIDILKDNSLDVYSSNALKNIYESLDKSSNIALLQEYDDIFNNPITKNIRLTASFYDEGVESGKKRLEMIQFLAKTKLRRNEKEFCEYEDSVGFVFSLLAELTNLVSLGEDEYENTVHCIFSEILNDFVDEFAKELYEHDSSVIYKELMIVLHSFIEFERLYLEVSKPVKKEKIEKEVCEVISEEEKERRARNKLLKALGPKKTGDDNFPIDENSTSAVETDI